MTKLFYGFAAVVVTLLLNAIAGGQQLNSSWLSDAERIRFERLRESGCEALYNLDYRTAQADFSEIARLFPQHPAGPQNLASVLLLETLYKSRRLQASLYSTKSFYSNGDDKVDPNILKQFRALTRDAQIGRSATSSIEGH